MPPLTDGRKTRLLPIRMTALPATLGQMWRFGGRVMRAFVANRGLLLAGGVAYNMLLSLVPLLVVLLLALSKIWPREQIVAILDWELQRIVPGHSDLVTTSVVAFIDDSGVIGVVVIAVLLFFSSLAFRMLEGAFGFIFHKVPIQTDRARWVSAVIPYIYILVLGLVLLSLAVAASTASALPENPLVLGNYELHLSVWASWLLQSAGFGILALLFTSLYLVLPVQNIAKTRAAIGGLVVAALWETVRHLLVWYFAKISLVNVIYGSLATVVVVLLTMEVAAIIILLGAQVIAELECNATAGLKWHGEASRGAADGANTAAAQRGVVNP